MMMSEDKHLDHTLEALFDVAKTQELQPSDALMARILADAEAEQPPHLALLTTKTRTGRGLFKQLWGAIGGWPAVAGLATATMAGLWIGMNPSVYVADVMAQYTGSDSDLYLVDFVSAYDFDLGEG